ncbi:GAK system XXXCH domain-containing protein [Desulfolutivibrio sulfoxidireducens]|uniref:GAK system XXXCH domain-containing protein n=1 Tax=Desulfolutivibrio sulfoxidireducens TaxID=2773299 RepID=UPI00159EB2D3|nr:GAK system XXXCH domain-containing protein [Desulfolutivibrio sulfoxidireducens]QLA17667.1 GAK system XXXCH domain-containing protein [Desulfolutivibrio sulfoxidireducens]
MAPPPKPKLEKTLDRGDLASFLRHLADEAQSGALSFPQGPVPLQGMKALKITVKDTGRALRAKVRIKFPKPGEPDARPDGPDGPGGPGGPQGPTAPDTADAGTAGGETAPARPRYTSLKKRMKRDFKDIGASLAAGFDPKPAVVASFLADSRLMTTYRGKGDASYPDYLAALAAFETAAASGEPEAMVQAYRELAARKKQCHARHA